jgi:ferrochelatase
MKKGLLLINLGTPNAPDPKAVRRYLREFLLDKRVINLPTLLRYFIVYCLILPFRPKRSAHAYQAIWTSMGSPLLINSELFTQKVQKNLEKTHHVVLGMRYGQPSLHSALLQLKNCRDITILPLYPQYASSSTGSAIEAILSYFQHQPIIPSLHIIRDFYQHPGFIKAFSAQIKPFITESDFILFSYHGVPENHLLNAPCKKICNGPCTDLKTYHESCYRAQCYRTTQLIAEHLSLAENTYTTAFQSRLGRAAWIKPYTEETLVLLAQSGVKRLAVVCPAFVADCLETLEEIGIRAKEQWLSLGGESFSLIPCINDNDLFVNTVADLI